MAARGSLQFCALALLMLWRPVGAELSAVTPPPPPAGVTDGLAWRTSAALTTSARLDFVVELGKFIYLRLGAAPAFPAVDATAAMATFTLDASTLAGALAGPTSVALAEGLSLPGSGSLPVEVRSNAGQVSLRAQVTSPLASGSSQIPLSRLTLRSSDPGLPAPLVPDAGEGPAVLVQATSHGTLVTERTALWTFSLAVPAGQAPGAYAGQVSFIASTP